MNYTHKYENVEAVQWTGKRSSTDEILDFAAGFAMVQKRTMNRATRKWKTESLSIFVCGDHYATANPGDFIVKDSSGRFHVYSPSEFNSMYIENEELELEAKHE